MKDKTPLSHEVVRFHMIDFKTSNSNTENFVPSVSVSFCLVCTLHSVIHYENNINLLGFLLGTGEPPATLEGALLTLSVAAEERAGMFVLTTRAAHRTF